MTLSNVKREVESLKIEMRALRTSHLTETMPRAPWSPEEKRRDEMNGHTEYDDKCEICVKTRGISRYPRHVYSESCSIDCASVTFKDSCCGNHACQLAEDLVVTCFCCSGTTRKTTTDATWRLSSLSCRARCPCDQARSDNEEALRHGV